MHEFKASLIGGQNLVFRPFIKIDDYGVTFKVPGLFSGDEKTIDFDSISSVSISGNPLVKDIIITTKGIGRIKAEGFSSGDAKEIKEIIEDYRQKKSKGNKEEYKQKILSKEEFESKKREQELAFLHSSKEIELAKIRRENDKIEKERLEKERAIVIQSDKEAISNKYKSIGFFIICWKYKITHTWQKIAVIIFIFITLYFAFKVTSDSITYFWDNNQFYEDVVQVENKKKFIDSLVSIRDFEQARINLNEIEFSVKTDNIFLKNKASEFNRVNNWFSLNKLAEIYKIEESKPNKKY